jgi:hypothetical protein
MQAADLLAIEEHVQDVCSVLASRMFGAKAPRDSTGIQEFPQQVFLDSTPTAFESLVNASWCLFTVMSNFCHPVGFTVLLQSLTVAHRFAQVSCC